MEGGYIMIDCAGLDLGEPGTVAGLYDRLAAAIKTNKMITLYNLKNGDFNFTPVSAFASRESSTSIAVSFFPVVLHVSNLDVVTI